VSARGPLPPGVVARVGGRSITVAEVSRIALAQGLDRAAARDVAVQDTLFALGAEANGRADSLDARLAWRGELARRLLRRILAEARATPPTEAELRDAAARRWLEIDRPEGFRTVHAVVRFDPSDADEKKARARSLAEAIHAAALPIAERAAALPLRGGGAPPSGPRIAPQDDPDPLSAAFRQAVAALPAGGLEVTAEPLPAVTAAGRLLIAGDQHLDEDFTRAATALPARGALSPVVESRFGAHVILLLERTPAVVLDHDARLVKLRDDIVNERARAAEKQLLAGLGERRSVAPDVAALLGLVAVDR
jgi:peptidyl-prolyl cis-trans isomerase C